MSDQNPSTPPGIGLRTMALTTNPDELGFAPDANFPSVYGVVTDWNLGEVTATVMAMRDGSASLYTTSTFGVIGGQEHQSVREAAQQYVLFAEQFLDSSEPVSEFPYPVEDEVFYYLLTYDGVRRCIGSESAIHDGDDPTLPLFAAAQAVLTELRMIVEAQDNARSNGSDN